MRVEIESKKKKSIMTLLQTLTLLAQLIITIRSQRPLNTTTNTTSVLTEPFFVKPTSIIKFYHPEQRSNGGGILHQSNQELSGILIKERKLPPSHPNSHLDIFVPHINVGDQTMNSAQSQASSAPAANNRLHKVNKIRLGKINQLRELTKNPNITRLASFTHGKIASKPLPYNQGTNADNGDDLASSGPSSNGNSLNKIKIMQREQYNMQHTPSPPPYIDDIDFDEKLGVKCTFEKPCAWTWDKNVTGPNFEVITGANLTKNNVTGN